MKISFKFHKFLVLCLFVFGLLAYYQWQARRVVDLTIEILSN